MLRFSKLLPAKSRLPRRSGPSLKAQGGGRCLGASYKKDAEQPEEGAALRNFKGPSQVLKPYSWCLATFQHQISKRGRGGRG